MSLCHCLVVFHCALKSKRFLISSCCWCCCCYVVTFVIGPLGSDRIAKQKTQTRDTCSMHRISKFILFSISSLIYLSFHTFRFGLLFSFYGDRVQRLAMDYQIVHLRWHWTRIFAYDWIVHRALLWHWLASDPFSIHRSYNIYSSITMWTVAWWSSVRLHCTCWLLLSCCNRSNGIWWIRSVRLMSRRKMRNRVISWAVVRCVIHRHCEPFPQFNRWANFPMQFVRIHGHSRHLCFDWFLIFSFQICEKLGVDHVYHPKRRTVIQNNVISPSIMTLILRAFTASTPSSIGSHHSLCPIRRRLYAISHDERCAPIRFHSIRTRSIWVWVIRIKIYRRYGSKLRLRRSHCVGSKRDPLTRYIWAVRRRSSKNQRRSQCNHQTKHDESHPYSHRFAAKVYSFRRWRRIFCRRIGSRMTPKQNPKMKRLKRQ